MTPAQLDRLERHLPGLQKAWDVMLTSSAAPPDIDWADSLALRHEIDPLADHAWAAGYIVGVAVALAVPLDEVVRVLRPRPAPRRTARRRIVRVG